MIVQYDFSMKPHVLIEIVCIMESYSRYINAHFSANETLLLIKYFDANETRPKMLMPRYYWARKRPYLVGEGGGVLRQWTVPNL